MLRTGFILMMGFALLCESGCRADDPSSGDPSADGTPSDLADASAGSSADSAGLPAPDTGMQPPSTAGSPSLLDESELRKELMARWNTAVGMADTEIDFHWVEFERFPHPTYKGGTAEGYQAFATILLALFRQGDNFDFMARNRLFDLQLVYVFDGGTIGLKTTFRALAKSFASPDGFGDIPATTRQSLQEYLTRIEAEGH